MRAHWIHYRRLFFMALILSVLTRLILITVIYMPSQSMAPGIPQGSYLLGGRWAYGWGWAYDWIGSTSDESFFSGGAPKRGDLVSFFFPGDNEQVLVRRVIGLPGDQIEIIEGVIRINGRGFLYKELAESLPPKSNQSQDTAEVPGAAVPGASSKGNGEGQTEERVCRLEKAPQSREGSYEVCFPEKLNMENFQVPEESVFVLSDDRFFQDDSRVWGVVPLDSLQSRILWILNWGSE